MAFKIHVYDIEVKIINAVGAAEQTIHGQVISTYSIYHYDFMWNLI